MCPPSQKTARADLGDTTGMEIHTISMSAPMEERRDADLLVIKPNI